jgi:multiple sugar transport system permease protein
MFVFGLAFTFLLAIVPVLSGVWLSFHRADSYAAIPAWAGLSNYQRLFNDSQFWRAVGNGFIYCGLSTTLQSFLGLLFALVLNAAFPLRRLIRALVILPYLLPTVIAALIFQWMTDSSIGPVTALTQQIGLGIIPWFDSPGAARASVVLVSAWLWTPFVTVCSLAAMQSIPLTLYEAARVDGAGAWNRFWHITLPQLMPVLSAVILLRLVWMFNKFDVIWLLTKGGPLGATEHLPVLAYNRAFNLFDAGGGAAIATAGFLLLISAAAIYLILAPGAGRR